MCKKYPADAGSCTREETGRRLEEIMEILRALSRRIALHRRPRALRED